MSEEKKKIDLKKIIGALLRAGYELTKRQAEIFLLIAQGKKDKEIAGLLYIAPSTVRTHHECIFKKLAVHSKAELAELAKQLGLLPVSIPFSEN
ncbi:MAG: response regulator transcription factor [Bacteroidetes bacterium]|nr:response regulator transcription factor [Bacteroidota bacterium]